MATPRYLSRAPITEAVIDIRAKSRTGLAADELLAAAEGVQSHYPRHENITVTEFGIVQAKDKPPQQHVKDLGKQGFRCLSEDGRQIVQFRTDGFTFSRLAPYTRWEDVFAEAMFLWVKYRAVAEVEEAVRLAVRYINRLPLPADRIKDFSPFLTAPPPVPKELPVFLTSFLTRVVLHPPETSITANVIQALQQGTGEADIPVILDIDVFETGVFDPNPEALEPRFAALRQIKNQIFFASVTEEAVSLFV